ncbi:nitroreductase/quinone reductase family protein [Actinoallomurus sp. NPDC052274]|uniref:nitroreductase/quinone reductase family protein n=1 Tax=Actinoallomurus sp. NPDC052274 TaxID=3155420 RepID=UPI00342B0458
MDTSTTDWRALNAQAISRLRENAPGPYREGRPVPRVISVVGRRSGRPRPFPVNITPVDGRLYLCSATRRRDWVRNLLAAGRCTVERDGPHGADTDYVPVLVEGEEAARVMATYLPQAGYEDPQLPFAIDAPVEQITPHTTAIAVFRLDPCHREDEQNTR